MNYYKDTTLGCKFVSFQIVAGSGLGDKCPTIVGPNTLARLGIGTLFPSQWAATLQSQDTHIYYRIYCYQGYNVLALYKHWKISTWSHMASIKWWLIKSVGAHQITHEAEHGTPFHTSIVLVLRGNGRQRQSRKIKWVGIVGITAWLFHNHQYPLQLGKQRL